MVCAKCQKLVKQTKLATPDVKNKKDMYYGSPASTSKGTKSTGGGAGAGTTLGSSGVSKSKLLGKGAKNPYAAYSSTCAGCPTKTEAGRKYCQRCAYTKNACPICGKSMAAQASGSSKAPVVQGQKFTMK
ncbi:hypothetical protein MBLNU459_g7491t1 [Dothideomycetes sp. NU459]